MSQIHRSTRWYNICKYWFINLAFHIISHSYYNFLSKAEVWTDVTLAAEISKVRVRHKNYTVISYYQLESVWFLTKPWLGLYRLTGQWRRKTFVACNWSLSFKQICFEVRSWLFKRANVICWLCRLSWIVKVFSQLWEHLNFVGIAFAWSSRLNDVGKEWIFRSFQVFQS